MFGSQYYIQPSWASSASVSTLASPDDRFRNLILVIGDYAEHITHMSSISSNCSLDLLSRQDQTELVSVFRYSTQVFPLRRRLRVKILTRISETSFTDPAMRNRAGACGPGAAEQTIVNWTAPKWQYKDLIYDIRTNTETCLLWIDSSHAVGGVWSSEAWPVVSLFSTGSKYWWVTIDWTGLFCLLAQYRVRSSDVSVIMCRTYLNLCSRCSSIHSMQVKHRINFIMTSFSLTIPDNGFLINWSPPTDNSRKNRWESHLGQEPWSDLLKWLFQSFLLHNFLKLKRVSLPAPGLYLSRIKFSKFWNIFNWRSEQDRCNSTFQLQRTAERSRQV